MWVLFIIYLLFIPTLACKVYGSTTSILQIPLPLLTGFPKRVLRSSPAPRNQAYLWRHLIVHSSLSLRVVRILFSPKPALQFRRCPCLFSKFKRKILLTPSHAQNALVNCRLCAGADTGEVHGGVEQRLFLLRKIREGDRVHWQGDCVPRWKAPVCPWSGE